MKRKILSLILLLLMTLLALASCKITNNPDEDGGSGGAAGSTPDIPSGAVTVFSPEVSVNVIKGDIGDGGEKLLALTEDIFNLTGKFAILNTDSSAKEGNELVFGDSSREITSMAKEKLASELTKVKREYEDLGKNAKYVVCYVIYAHEGSVAVVWSDDSAKDMALDFFKDNFLTAPTLALETGYCYHEAASLIDIYKEQEEIEREAKYALVAAEYGEDVAQAIKNHLSMFDERFYMWLADLYDPGEYDEEGNPLGGGFYFSNSGRDNPGFDIDLESTLQVLSAVSSSGMLPDGMKFKDVIPERIQKEIVAFTLSCQSPVDGYFYHPQWGTDVPTSRISRDLSWAISLLSHFGAKPYWNTPSGTEGIYGEPPGEEPVEAISTPLSSRSAVTAVSKVVPAAKKWNGSSQLETIASWESYLQSFDATIHETEYQAYSIGNTFSSQAAQIKNRESLAIENGELSDLDGDGIAEGGYIRLYEKYFNGWQYENCGLWWNCSVEDGTVPYNAINALMKISGTYSTLGIKFPNAEKALEAAIWISNYLGDGENWEDCKGKGPTSSVDVYNPWVAISRLLSNINTFGSKEESAALRQQLKDNAAEMISVTTTKIAKFKKDDGSYGYNWGGVGGNSQGCPVAISGTIEGDVNGGGIAFTGTYTSMCDALGMISIAPDRFGYSDLLVFIDRISELEPVIKEDMSLIGTEPATFDDDEEGSDVPSGVSLELNTGSAVVLLDPRDSEGVGKVLSLSTKAGKGTYLRVPIGAAKNANCLLLEWDMCLQEMTYTGSLFQIQLNPAYMLVLSRKGDKLVVGDSSNTTGSVAISNTFFELPLYDWYNFRIEHYPLDTESKTAVTKIYVDGRLRAVSDNYYGKEADDEPETSYKQAFFYCLSGSEFTTYFDNVFAAHIIKGYEEEEIYNPDRVKDFELSTVGGAMPNGVTSAGGSIVAAPTENNEENKALLLSGSGKNVTISATSAAASPNAYVFNANLKIDAVSEGDVGMLYMIGNSKTSPIHQWIISTYKEGDTLYASLTEKNSAGTTGTVFKGLPVGEWFELEIEFHPYRYQSATTSRVYLNGEPIGYGTLYFGDKTVARDYAGMIIETSAAVDIYVDDAISERLERIFVNADGNAEATPNIELPKGGESSNTAAGSQYNGKLDFEGVALGVPVVPGLKTSVNTEPGNSITVATDPKNAANQVLRHEASKADSGATTFNVTASKLSPSNANCVVVSFDILCESATSETTLQPWIIGKLNGSDVRMFQTGMSFTGDWTKGSGTITTKVTQRVNGSEKSFSLISSTGVSGWLNVRYEIYTDKGIAKIFYDDKFICETEQIYDEANIKADFSYVTFWAVKASEDVIYFDDIVCEKIVKEYTSQSSSGGSGSGSGDSGSGDSGSGDSGSGDSGSDGDEENTPIAPPTASDNGFFDFEGEQTYTFDVDGVTSVNQSTGSYAFIVEDPTDENGKVLAFNSEAGKNDSLIFSPKALSGVTDPKTLVFEFDVWFEDYTAATGTFYQIFFEKNGKSNCSYLLNLAIDKNGYLVLGDASATSGTNVSQNFGVSGVLAYHAWNTIRVEYGFYEGVPTAKVYLNGDPVATSNNYFKELLTSGYPAFEFGQIRMFSLKDRDALIYVDNVTAKVTDEPFTLD